MPSLKATEQEIERNSRAVQCLVKSISEQTVMIKSIKEDLRRL